MVTNPVKYLNTIRANVGLAEGQQVLEKILIEIYMHPGISTKVLARKSLLPVPVTAAIKKEAIKTGVLSKRHGISLTSEGQRYLEEDAGFSGIDLTLYAQIINSHCDVQKLFQEELKTLGMLLNDRPQVDVTLDQSKCTPLTSLKRAVHCLQHTALIGKQILCLGDDDLVSVAVGLLLQKLFGKKTSKTHVHVVDIDPRFLDYIQAVAAQYDLPIECYHADLRIRLPQKLSGRCDSVFTDPPYTLPGLELFLSRGIDGLKSMVGLAIFLSFAHKSPDFTVDMQKTFTRMGLTITEMIPSFNTYEGAEMIGNASQMIVLRTTSQSRSIVAESFEEPIYTGELRKTLRAYQCKKCHKVIQVGLKENYRTIEELKNAGCPQCRNKTFELIKRQVMSYGES